MEKEVKKSRSSKIKKILHIVTNYSAIVWAVCVIVVIAILAVSSKFMTYDPDFSPGDPENGYLLPMLSFFFVGFGAFGLMFVSGIASRIIKGEKPEFKAPFGLSIKKIFLGMGVLAFGLFAFFFAFRQANMSKYQSDSVTQIPTYTGQDIFDAVNVYRKQNGVQEIKLDQALCNNLVSRWQTLSKPDTFGHHGLYEWYDQYVAPYGNYRIYEDFAGGNTPQEVIKSWEGSPGHRLSILEPKATVGCSYAHGGFAVIELGYKQSYAQKTTSYNQTPSRTGKIISYHEWCSNKDISIYENELITKKSSDGNTYTMTQGDWECYENFLKK